MKQSKINITDKFLRQIKQTIPGLVWEEKVIISIYLFGYHLEISKKLAERKR